MSLFRTRQIFSQIHFDILLMIKLPLERDTQRANEANEANEAATPYLIVYESCKNWLNQLRAAFFPLAIASRSPAFLSSPRTKQACSTPGKC